MRDVPARLSNDDAEFDCAIGLDYVYDEMKLPTFVVSYDALWDFNVAAGAYE